MACEDHQDSLLQSQHTLFLLHSFPVILLSVAVTTVASQQEGPGFESTVRPSCEESACVLRLPPTHMQSVG